MGGLLGGWLGPALSVLGQRQAAQNTGRMQGEALLHDRQMEDAKWQAEQERQAMQMKLWQAELEKAQRPEPPQAWAPTSMQEYQQVHPGQTENIDPLSDTGITAALRRKRGEAQIDAQIPKPPSDSEQAQDAEGQSILSQMSQGQNIPSATKQSFAQAYGQVLQAHRDWTPGKVAYHAYKGVTTTDPTVKPTPDKPENPALQQLRDAMAAHGQAPAAPDAIPDAPVPTAPAPQVVPAAPPGANQEAMAQRWDELTAGGMDPEQAKQQVLREFGGQ